MLSIAHNLAYFFKFSTESCASSGTGIFDSSVTLDEDIKTAFSKVDWSIFHRRTSHTWNKPSNVYDSLLAVSYVEDDSMSHSCSPVMEYHVIRPFIALIVFP